jgi:hypothetical protein
MDAAQIRAVYLERVQVGGQAGFPVGRDQFIGVLVRDDRGDAGDGHHSERGRNPYRSVGHRNSSSRQAIRNGSSSP